MTNSETGSAGDLFKQVIVPIDAAHTHHRELAPAGALARLAGAEVVLLTVLRTGHQADAALESRLDSLSRELLPLAARVEIVTDAHPADGIVAFAAANPDSVLCMASHGPGRLAENLHTTVSAPVVLAAPCPVVLVGPRCDDPDPSYKEVVACVDGSPVARNVASHAGRWSRAFSLEPWLVDALGTEPPEGTEAVGADVLQDGYLRNLVRSLNQLGVHPQWDVLHDAHPAHPHHAILDYLSKHPQALVMMGTHHHTPLQHLTHGSVVMQVTHQATTPVVIIPSAPHGS